MIAMGTSVFWKRSVIHCVSTWVGSPSMSVMIHAIRKMEQIVALNLISRVPRRRASTGRLSGSGRPYNRATSRIVDTTILLDRFICNFQMTGSGSDRMKKSKMTCAIPNPVHDFSVSMHVPGSIGFHARYTGLQAANTTTKLLIHQAMQRPSTP